MAHSNPAETSSSIVFASALASTLTAIDCRLRAVTPLDEALGVADLNDEIGSNDSSSVETSDCNCVVKENHFHAIMNNGEFRSHVLLLLVSSYESHVAIKFPKRRPANLTGFRFIGH